MNEKRPFLRVEDLEVYQRLCGLHIEMLNGLEKTLESKIPEADRRWLLRETPPGWPFDPDT